MNPIPDDVRRFVLLCIPSVPYLEAALLFHRAPDKGCAAADVARALYLPERSAEELLESLVSGGLIASAPEGAGQYVYAPRDEAMALALDRLAQAYSTNLVGVTKLIHDATQKNAQRFADAFKLRKDR